MEPFIKRSWIIDSMVIILLALAMPYLRTYHIDKYLFQFPLVTFLIFYFIGKTVQKYNDKKRVEEQLEIAREKEASSEEQKMEPDSEPSDLTEEDKQTN